MKVSYIVYGKCKRCGSIIEVSKHDKEERAESMARSTGVSKLHPCVPEHRYGVVELLGYDIVCK